MTHTANRLSKGGHSAETLTCNAQFLQQNSKVRVRMRDAGEIPYMMQPTTPSHHRSTLPKLFQKEAEHVSMLPSSGLVRLRIDRASEFHHGADEISSIAP
jgi:hypothetical protein